MPVILDWRDAGAWMAGDNPHFSLLRAPPEDSQGWIVSSRVNRSGVGDDDPALIEPRRLRASEPRFSANTEHSRTPCWLSPALSRWPEMWT
jgi:hypothetical protein